ncbi:MAG: isoprenylcysteine carboxylmethyltransferase family protein [Candidatus Omnitrophota bacterium]
MLNKRWKKRFSRWFKLRFAIMYPFGIWAVFSRYSTDASISRSLWFILLGILIRCWANGYAVKMEKLTTSGPYAYVRNPLYLGTFLIMIGFLIMLNIPLVWALFFVSVVIWFIYGKTVKNEEKILQEKFREEYLAYKKHVPAFSPALSPYKLGDKWGWSFIRYLKSQEYKLFLWVIILIIAFHLKEEFFVERENIDFKIMILSIAAVCLSLIDAVGEFFRKGGKGFV